MKKSVFSPIVFSPADVEKLEKNLEWGKTVEFRF